MDFTTDPARMGGLDIMANGDAAALAGMDVVPSTASRSLGYDEINKTRDYIADFAGGTTPIAEGGTGATTAAGARTNLGVQTTVDAVAAATASGDSGGGSNLVRFNGSGRIGVADPTSGKHAANRDYADTKLSKSGDTMSGNLYLASAAPVTSGYTSLWRNGDGRVGVSASSLRFKKDVKTDTPCDIAALRPVTFKWRAGVDPATNPTHVEHGLIAEEVADVIPWLVVPDEAGQPLSVRYEFLGLALLPTVQALMSRVDELTAEVAALKAASGG
jgi:hypothetical protein